MCKNGQTNFKLNKLKPQPKPILKHSCGFFFLVFFSPLFLYVLSHFISFDSEFKNLPGQLDNKQKRKFSSAFNMEILICRMNNEG